MNKKKRVVGLVVWLSLSVVFLISGLLVGGPAESHGTVKEGMRDAVLHESNGISFLGLKDVKPAVITGFVVTAVLLTAAACIRIFVIPRFKYVPGRFQLLLEEVVGFFNGLAKFKSLHLHRRKSMNLKKRLIGLGVWLSLSVVFLISGLLVGGPAETHGTVKEAMRDAVLHESNRISLFGLKDVNPAVISGFVVTAVLLTAAACIRIFAIPRFKYVPGRFQLLLEELVGFFNGLAKSNSPHRNKFLGAYIFGAGVYIFVGTIFELFGLQGVTTNGLPMTLPAPLSDINAAIALGCLSYAVILSGGIAGNGLKGVGSTLKDFSLPISMSFRMFGALLSGLLVTELVYYYTALRFVVPVVVAVVFTLLHALIQTYVLTMLTSLFYGEVSEKHVHKEQKEESGGGLKRRIWIMKMFKRVFAVMMLVTMLFMVSGSAFASETAEPAAAGAVQEAVQETVQDGGNVAGDKAMAAAICVGFAAAAGAIGMGWAISKASEGISRQPEAEGKIRTTLMLGLVFIETAIIYALIVGILIIFVL